MTSSYYRGYTGHTTQTFQKLPGYKTLLAWQVADELAAQLHPIVIRFDFQHGKLSSQMLGSASSVKANIAEGYCRTSLGDYIRFLEFARGSLGELGSQFQDCERWNLIDAETLTHLLKLYGDALYFLGELMKGLKQKQRDGGWDKDMGLKEEQAPYLTSDSGTWLAPWHTITED